MIFRILSMIMLVLLSTSSIFAEAVEEGEQKKTGAVSKMMETIVVTARRIAESLVNTPENVAIIEGTELERTGAHDLGEALSFVPGLVVQGNGGFGRPVSISIQGSQPRHVRIMVDGIPFNTQSEGTADLSQFPLEIIDRVEIIKGAASASWGSALGGVVNIITKPAVFSREPAGKFTGQFGEWSTAKGILQVGAGNTNLGFLFTASELDTDGFRPRSAVKEKKFYGKVSSSEEKDIAFTSSAGYSQGTMGDFEYVDFGFASDFQYLTRYGSLGLQYHPSDTITCKLTAKASDRDTERDYFLLGSDVPFSSFTTRNQFWGLDAESSFVINPTADLAFGLESGWYDLTSDDLSTSRSLDEQALYVNLRREITLGDWLLGARYDRNGEFGNLFSPMVGFVYYFSEQESLLRATVSRAFNAPPLLYKYIDLPGRLPNPDLRAERAWVYELGMESELLANLSGKISFYLAEVSDAIETERTDGGDLIKRNFARHRRSGGEAELYYEIAPRLTAYASGAFNDIEDRRTGETIKGGGRGRIIYQLGLDYALPREINFSLQGSSVWWNEKEASEANDRKFIWDSRFTFPLWQSERRGRGEAFIAIYNLGNSSYWWHKAFPQPGRHFEGGFIYYF